MIRITLDYAIAKYINKLSVSNVCKVNRSEMMELGAIIPYIGIYHVDLIGVHICWEYYTC